MKQIVITTLIVILVLTGCYLVFRGYRNYQIYQASGIASEHEIHLEQVGNFSVTAPLSGRSLFRPGGVLEIFLGKTGLAFGSSIAGKGIVRVRDATDRICLEEKLNEFSVGISSRGSFIAFPREFDASTSGPYRVEFDILEPFKLLAGTSQILSVHYFVCGEEQMIHFIQFGVSILFFGLSTFLVWKFIVKKSAK
ncbi:MAG: hypothetical protein RL380_1561 [Verrucomicrobiota bacterium]